MANLITPDQWDELGREVYAFQRSRSYSVGRCVMDSTGGDDLAPICYCQIRISPYHLLLNLF